MTDATSTIAMISPVTLFLRYIIDLFPTSVDTVSHFTEERDPLPSHIPSLFARRHSSGTAAKSHRWDYCVRLVRHRVCKLPRPGDPTRRMPPGSEPALQ